MGTVGPHFVTWRCLVLVTVLYAVISFSIQRVVSSCCVVWYLLEFGHFMLPGAHAKSLVLKVKGQEFFEKQRS